MQPFSPVLIIVLFCIGVGLAVFAVFASPGAPLFASRPAQTRVLEPIKIGDQGIVTPSR